MKRKYDMRICKCGRIHMIPIKDIDTALKNNKNFLLICAGCGFATQIGADVEPDWYDPSKTCYNMYSYEFSKNKSMYIDPESFENTENKKGIEKIFYSEGYRVMMMTGMYATDYYNGRFSDRWYPDFYKIQRNDITVEEIMEFIKEYTHNRTTVNMRAFIKDTPEEILDEISCYMISGLNFKGTKYEKEWHK